MRQLIAPNWAGRAYSRYSAQHAAPNRLSRVLVGVGDGLRRTDLVLERTAVERFSPTLLFGWTFDKSPSGYIGFEVSYTHQHKGTFGGYAHALLLSDPDAASRRGQFGVGALAGPWWAPRPSACGTELDIDPRPLGRVGYAWRGANSAVQDTSFVVAGASANAILGLIFTIGIPLQSGEKFHSLQPNLAITIGAPLIIGHGW